MFIANNQVFDNAEIAQKYYKTEGFKTGRGCCTSCEVVWNVAITGDELLGSLECPRCHLSNNTYFAKDRNWEE